jgi:LPXTG-motif cell wall-anchored protein
MELETRHELPKTASSLPLIVLVGLGSLAVAFGLFAVGRRARATV